MGELRINISNLSEGTHEHVLTIEPNGVGLGEPFLGPIGITAVLEKTTRQLYLSVDVKGRGKFVCDRCLDDFERELTGSYAVVFVSDEREAGSTDEEVQVLSPDTNIIELDEDVRQFLQLAVPLKLVCREECQGLCPQCGVNRNTGSCSCVPDEPDPRWDALKKIAKN